jgi:PAS domain S-box-containing protein
MASDRNAGRLRLSRLAVLVLIVCLLGTILAWLVVRANELSHMHKTISLAVTAVHADLSYDMESWTQDQVGLAQLWEFDDPSYPEWTAFANLYIGHHPGCLAIAWLDPDYQEHAVVHPAGNTWQQLPPKGDTARERLLNTALQSGKATISKILTSGSGEKRWLAAVPIYQQGQFRGFVLASFDAQQSLDTMLDDIKVLNFSVAVEDNGRESYRLVGGNEQYRNEWPETFDVSLPGDTWRMRIWPKPEAMADMRSRLPFLTLLFGSLVTLLLTWTAQMHGDLRAKITERQRMEEVLRASQARFAGILEISPDAVISTDASQRIILYNQAAERVFGYTAKEALGQPLDILIPERLRAVHDKHFAYFAQSDLKNMLMSERDPVTGLRKDGTEFPMAASISKLRSGDETVFTVLCQDITAQVRAKQELRRAHDELELRVLERTADLEKTNLALQSEIAERRLVEKEFQVLSGRVMRVQDEERRHLARELHDGATQNLVAVALNLGCVRLAAVDDPATLILVEESLQLVKECTSELRTISYLLHPPLLEEMGVARTLSGYVDGFSRRSGIEVTLTTHPELDRLHFELELAIFRIVQEALSNIHRHANSPNATIILAPQGNQLVLEIEDHGRGIPPGAEGTGVGIAGMRERVRLLGGELVIRSGRAGTTIRAVWPLAESTLSPSCSPGAVRPDVAHLMRQEW